MLKKLVFKSNEKVNLNDVKMGFEKLTKAELQEKVIGGQAYSATRASNRKTFFF